MSPGGAPSLAAAAPAAIAVGTLTAVTAVNAAVIALVPLPTPRPGLPASTRLRRGARLRARSAAPLTTLCRARGSLLATARRASAIFTAGISSALIPVRSALGRAAAAAVPGPREPREVDLALQVARQEPANHQRRVGAAGQLEGQRGAALAAGHRALQLDLELPRPHEHAPILALELEAAHALDAELLGAQALAREGHAQPAPLGGVLDVLEPLAGQAQGAEPGGIEVQAAIGEDLRPLDRLAQARAGAAGEVGQERRQGAVPDVRLEGVEVDQAQTRGDVIEGAGEVLGLAP